MREGREEEEGRERARERGGGDRGGIALHTSSSLYTAEAMHSVEIKRDVLVSWVASVVTMVARGAAKKMIVKKLQTSPS